MLADMHRSLLGRSMLSYVTDIQLRTVSIGSCANLLPYVIRTAARVCLLPAQDSDIWIIAWMIYRAQAKATDVRGHEVSSLSARDKLRLLSYQGKLQTSCRCSQQTRSAVAMFCMLCHHRCSSSDAQMAVNLLQGANSATMRTRARSTGRRAHVTCVPATPALCA